MKDLTLGQSLKQSRGGRGVGTWDGVIGMAEIIGVSQKEK